MTTVIDVYDGYVFTGAYAANDQMMVDVLIEGKLHDIVGVVYGLFYEEAWQ